MKIEILFPELCNLYGDSFNARYLSMCFEDATIYRTSINSKPKFLTDDVNIIYLGSCSERHQELIINKLMKYKDDIKKYIDDKKILIATGNSLEIFEQYIMDENRKIECLGIFNGYAVRNMQKRHNSLFLGEYNGIKVLGHKSQFSFSYNNDKKFIEKKRGVGMNEDDNNEGICYKNFYGTYLLGPFLVFNPDLAKKILKIKKLPFEKETYDAYNYRLKEFVNPKTDFVSKH